MAERQAPHHVRASSRGRTAAIAAGAVVAVILVALVAMRLADHGSGQPQASPTKTVKPVSLRSPITKGTVTPSVIATVPAAFAGTWSGQVQQPPSDTYTVSLSLATGSTSGTASYATAAHISCSPALTVTQVASHELILTQGAQGSCTAGTLTLTLTGANSVWYHFYGGGLTVTGTLTRS